MKTAIRLSAFATLGIVFSVAALADPFNDRGLTPTFSSVGTVSVRTVELPRPRMGFNQRGWDFTGEIWVSASKPRERFVATTHGGFNDRSSGERSIRGSQYDDDSAYLAHKHW